MPIKHPTIKVPGNTLAAIADWNANHTIDPGTILRSATLIVAASDSLDTTNADYFCDGVADEVQINAAITALPATGGSVCLMDGTFDIDTSISITKANVSLIGQGKSTRILTDDNVTMITSNSDYTYIKDIFLYGNTGTSNHGMNLSACNYSKVNDCWIYLTDDAIILGQNNNIIEGCFFLESDKGVYTGAGNYNLITGCNFYSIDAQAVYLWGWANLCTSCVFKDCNYGIQLSSSKNSAVGNSFHGTSKCITLGGYGGTVTGNFAYNPSQFIIVGGYNYNCSVVGNYCEKATYSCYYSIGPNEGTAFVGNTSLDFQGSKGAIHVENSTDFVVCGNTLIKSDRNGIEINTSSNGVIEANNIRDCSEDANNTYSGILLTGTSTYNVVSGNRISGGAANKHQYGIREAAAADDWNLLHGNILTDAVTANLSSQGVNSVSADNIAP